MQSIAQARMLHSRTVRWRTAFSYALVVLLIMAALAFFGLRLLAASALDARVADATQQTAATAQSPTLPPIWDDAKALTAQLSEWSTILNARGTAFALDGRPLADSAIPPQQMSTAIPRPEVRAAAAGGIGRSRRSDDVLAAEVMYIAYPVRRSAAGSSAADGGEIIGVLRWAFPITGLTAPFDAVRSQLLWLFGLTTLVLALLMGFQAERATATVRQLTGVAERITAGELDARIIALSSGEIGQLARAFNRMADNLEDQIRKSAQETDRLNTVMYVMTDGMIMVNKKGQVQLINPAAARLLNTTENDAFSRTFVQVVRDHRIAEVWQRCKNSGRQELDAIDLHGGRFLQVVVTPFLQGVDRGYLIMLQDLTRLRRLQTVRQDFVSNVSHELRTPLAALRALVDTLRDGALDDPPAAQRFLDRMEVEVDSLTQMVQELLELSRIESGGAPLEIVTASTDRTIRPGAERLRPQAERAELTLAIDIPPNLPNVHADAMRIQQVVTNLVHNAIKFTPQGGFITVTARHTGPLVTVEIKDTGVGIPAEDLPRIFERFYKADRARAGGGTGLGLAIAKHIVHAHQGDIWVKSRQGKGSSFFFTLPVADSSTTFTPNPNATTPNDIVHDRA